MKKYNDEYFTVRERRTHKKICDCGTFEDARMVMHLDGPNREIVKNKTLMAQVVDIKTPKALPTNEIVVNMDGGVGGSWKVSKEYLDSMYPDISDDTAEPIVKTLPKSDLKIFNP